jgi:hypothetical protein
MREALEKERIGAVNQISLTLALSRKRERGLWALRGFTRRRRAT